MTDNRKDRSQSKEIAIFEERSKLLRLISHPIRLLILHELTQSSRCVKDLNALVDIDQPNFSQHIAVLREADLVGCHQCGPLRCYYIKQPSLVRPLIKLLIEGHEVRSRTRDSVLREVQKHSKT
jgi:ArsR family transcriptional regulator